MKAKYRMWVIYTALALVQFVLFLLKITGAISWGWPVVLVPLWMFIGREILVLMIILFRVRKML